MRLMEKRPMETTAERNAKQELGQKIREIRTLKDSGGISQRKLANAVQIPPSNMKYIEDGVNAPSPRVYEAIVQYLKPEAAQLESLDRLYSAVRETPPPDVCRIVCDNEGMYDALRILRDRQLGEAQMSRLKELLYAFSNEGELLDA